MSVNQKNRLCTHIKVDGIRCGSPALREEVFCYFHQRMIRGVPTPPKSRIHPIALLESRQSIQVSLMEIINALVRNHIDVGRARLILRALYIAARNAQHLTFEHIYAKPVTSIPEYPEAESSGPFAAAVVQAEALAHIQTPTAEQTQKTETETFDKAFAALSALLQPKLAPNGKKPTSQNSSNSTPIKRGTPGSTLTQ